MRAASALLVLLLAGIALSQTQTDTFSCPPGYQRPDGCTIGPCRCSQFTVLRIQTGLSGNTDIWFNVTNICPEPMYYVSFSIGGLTVLAPTTQYTGTNHGVWTVTQVDGSQTPQTNPPIKWLRFSKSPVMLYSNITGGIGWEVFKFTVSAYSPTTLWTVQAHMGAKWDTFTGVDYSVCPCPNCDGGAASRIISPCTLGYPDAGAPANGKPARAAILFNENEVLHSYAIVGSYLQMFYNDEHALTLGVRQLLNSTSPTTTTPYTFTTFAPPTGYTAYCVWNPTDPYAAVDDATCPDGTACGRPLYPSLFITDITFDANNRSGDWQYGGAPLPPIKVCGTWKGVTKVAYGAACPTGTSQQGVLCTEADPIANQAGKNSWYLGTGSDPIVPCTGTTCAYEKYGAELIWNIDALGLDPAHRYRFQFIVHDGDQNKPGGDVGQACIIASAACPAGFAGQNCAFCDTNPLPGNNAYKWFCNPTGSTGADAYQLIKVPSAYVTQPPYSTNGGFVIADNKTDAQGYRVDCACRRTIVECPQSCCGDGVCDDTVGTCTCFDPATSSPIDCCPLPPPTTVPPPTTPPPTLAPGETTPPPPPTTPAPLTTTPPDTTAPPPPCYNDGAFCSGHGRCNRTTDTCACVPVGNTTYTGVACDTPISEPVCAMFSGDCNTCQNNATAANISCIWCNDGVAASCLPTAACLSPIYSCDVTVDYTPEPCADNCSYAQGGGECANTTFITNSTDPGIAAKNGTTILICICNPGYTGINCGDRGRRGLSVAAIAGISAGVIAAIVIGSLVCLAVVGYGTKRGVDYFYFDQKAFSNAHENPLHVEATTERANAMYVL